MQSRSHPGLRVSWWGRAAGDAGLGTDELIVGAAEHVLVVRGCEAEAGGCERKAKDAGAGGARAREL